MEGFKERANEEGEKSIWYTPGMRHNEAKEWNKTGPNTQKHQSVVRHRKGVGSNMTAGRHSPHRIR